MFNLYLHISQAPGEAEAELAYLNRIGVIDGILSDDVDNFLFGAMVVIRKFVVCLQFGERVSFAISSSSNTLSGNRANPVLNAAGKDDKNHTRIFRLQDISTHPEIRLTRGGMILIGLMSGGDYQQGGIMRCGITTAHGLAKCGFGDSLYTAATTLSRVQLAEFLVTWRHELRHELSTNSRGEIGRKQPALSKAIPEDFPDIDILLSYVRPITSESMGRESNNLKLTWAKEPDLSKLAGLCEFYFEWGYKESIIKRFRTIMWHSMTLRILRRAVLNLDAFAEPSTSSLPTTPKKRRNQVIQPSGTPSKLIAQHFSSLNIATPSKRDIFDSESEDEANAEERLILKIHGSRTHVSTDGMLEYRLEIAPKQLVRMAESGIKGTRVPEDPDEWASEEDEDEDVRTGKGKGGQKIPINPETHLRLWIPACMVALVEPQLVEEYENSQAQRGMKKSRSNRAGTREGKTSDQTTSKGKSNTKVDALIEMAKNTSPGKLRPASFTQKKTTSQGKSKAKLDTLSEMVKKTSPLKQRPVSPTPGISRSSNSKIKSYDKVIEVSSDSDSGDSLPSRIALPPLMVARARTTTKSIQATTTLSRPGKKAVGNSLTHTTESEVIDLT